MAPYKKAERIFGELNIPTSQPRWVAKDVVLSTKRPLTDVSFVSHFSDFGQINWLRA